LAAASGVVFASSVVAVTLGACATGSVVCFVGELGVLVAFSVSCVAGAAFSGFPQPAARASNPIMARQTAIRFFIGFFYLWNVLGAGALTLVKATRIGNKVALPTSLR
jgi:hypothetical protein